MICDNCGTPTPDNARFCPQCGASLGAPNTPSGIGPGRKIKTPVSNSVRPLGNSVRPLGNSMRLPGNGVWPSGNGMNLTGNGIKPLGNRPHLWIAIGIVAAAVVVSILVFIPHGKGADESAGTQSLTAKDVESIEHVNQYMEDMQKDREYQSDEGTRLDIVVKSLESLAGDGLVIKKSIYTDEESGIVTFLYSSNVAGCVMTRDFDSERESLAASGNSYGNQTRDEAPLSNDNSAKNPAQNTSKPTGTAKILCGAPDINIDTLELWEKQSNDWAMMGLKTDIDSDVTLDDLLDLQGYDFLRINMHGSFIDMQWPVFPGGFQLTSAPVMFVPQFPDTGSLLRFGDDLLNHRVGITITDNYGIGFIVFPDFISEHYNSGDFSDGLVWLASCELMGAGEASHEGWADAFLKNSAAAVIGFQNSVDVRYERPLSVIFVNCLLAGDPARQALDSAKIPCGEDDGHGAYPILRGDANARLRAAPENMPGKEKLLAAYIAYRSILKKNLALIEKYYSKDEWASPNCVSIRNFFGDGMPEMIATMPNPAAMKDFDYYQSLTIWSYEDSPKLIATENCHDMYNAICFLMPLAADRICWLTAGGDGGDGWASLSEYDFGNGYSALSKIWNESTTIYENPKDPVPLYSEHIEVDDAYGYGGYIKSWYTRSSYLMPWEPISKEEFYREIDNLLAQSATIMQIVDSKRIESYSDDNPYRGLEKHFWTATDNYQNISMTYEDAIAWLDNQIVSFGGDMDSEIDVSDIYKRLTASKYVIAPSARGGIFVRDEPVVNGDPRVLDDGNKVGFIPAGRTDYILSSWGISSMDAEGYIWYEVSVTKANNYQFSGWVREDVVVPAP